MPFLRERSGRWSALKIVAFVAAILPAAWLAARAWSDDLGPRPYDAAIHDTGSWAVRFLVMALAVSPARRIFAAPKLIQMRRTLGVTAACYAVLHLTLYTFDQKLDLVKVASEIVLRFYLTIGFVAFAGLIALGITSTDRMVQRLGARRWNALHVLAYPIAILAIIHFLLQTKLDISESVMVAGFLVWLLGYRLMHRVMKDVRPWHLLPLTVAAALLTAAGEAAWYGFGTGVNPWRVLSANLHPIMGLRPAGWVLIVGLVVAIAAQIRAFKTTLQPRARSRSQPPRAQAMSNLTIGDETK